MQLSLDAVDRLVDALEERAAPLDPVGAARVLFATRSMPVALASTLVGDVVAGDARLRIVGGTVALAGLECDQPLEQAEFVVFDLETTGLSAATGRICEIGAVRVRALESVDEFQTLVDPRVAMPAPISRLTGLHDPELRQAPRVATAVRGFVAFAGDTTLVAHNARFDLSFLDRQLERLYGRRRVAPALDTVALARRLLAGSAARALPRCRTSSGRRRGRAIVRCPTRRRPPRSSCNWSGSPRSGVPEPSGSCMPWRRRGSAACTESAR